MIHGNELANGRPSDQCKELPEDYWLLSWSERGLVCREIDGRDNGNGG